MYFDSHAHLEMAAFDADREAVFTRAAAAGVTRFVIPAYSLEASARAVALAEARDRVWASVGIHPHGAGRCTPEAVEALEALARHPRVVAIGETGLDFYRNRAPRQAQEAALRAQVALARRLGLPLIIHCRDAYPECLAILREEGAAEVGASCTALRPMRLLRPQRPPLTSLAPSPGLSPTRTPMASGRPSGPSRPTGSFSRPMPHT